MHCFRHESPSTGFRTSCVYRRWAWNFGESPPFTVQHRVKTARGEVELSVDVVHGFVMEVKLTDGPSGSLDVSEIRRRLKGVRYAEGGVENALRNLRR